VRRALNQPRAQPAGLENIALLKSCLATGAALAELRRAARSEPAVLRAMGLPQARANDAIGPPGVEAAACRDALYRGFAGLARVLPTTGLAAAAGHAPVVAPAEIGGTAASGAPCAAAASGAS